MYKRPGYNFLFQQDAFIYNHYLKYEGTKEKKSTYKINKNSCVSMRYITTKLISSTTPPAYMYIYIYTYTCTNT